MEIIKLDKIVASRIAAGEVVDRPASIVRELIDNAVDAGAFRITVNLEEGGIKKITVSDNGKGIAEEDLPLAFESHATSKIKTIDDLFNLHTLGFRGEALCSIASCSKLTLASRGKRLTVDNGVYGTVMPSAVTEGTTVTAQELFENIPARRQFLKRPSSEYAECKKVFIEKALGFENIEFVLMNEDKTDVHLIPATKYKRVTDVLSMDKNYITTETLEMSAEDEPVKLYAVASKPSQYRRDRGQMKIFVNGRIVDNYATVKVIANAYSSALPGGAFPYFYLFIEDSPELLDFNIHPAKRECKIRNQNFIFAPLTSMIRNTLMSLTRVKPETEEPEPVKPLFTQAENEKKFEYSTKENRTFYAHTSNVKFDPSWFENAKKILGNQSGKPTGKTEPKEQTANTRKYRYIGQVFCTFLVVQQEDKLLFIDQHAAHERLLYNEITQNTDVQSLIVPYRFETDRSVDDFLTENSFIYTDLGITLVRVQPMLWEIKTIPAQCRKNEQAIVDFISTATGDAEEAKKNLFAAIACHTAIKAGDELDVTTAKNLLDKVFELENPVCPHGRSFIYTISKEELFRSVGRIL